VDRYIDSLDRTRDYSQAEVYVGRNEFTPADARVISYLKALYKDFNQMCVLVQYVKTGAA
jgi:hypothetical protein